MRTAARRRSRSALPREMYYTRSRWSLAAEASKNLLSQSKTSVQRVRGHPVRQWKNDLLKDCDETINLSGSRMKSAKDKYSCRKERKERKK